MANTFTTVTSILTSPTPSATPLTVDPNNFADNAFSDFAPLLTLFGDEMTKQFLSTSMSWWDDILVGIAPIGIITIIISAIRISGNRFMKAIIGRARDSPDDGEKEILSSTSRNVREIWDGNQVVRQTGPLVTKTFVYDSAWKKSSDNSPFFPLENANGFGSSKIGGMDGVAVQPPNMILNIDGAIPKPLTVAYFAFVGLFLQLFVIAFNGLAVYRWQWPRAGHAIAAYGFSCWCVGTLAMSFGITLCATTIEDSTMEWSVTSTSPGVEDTGNTPIPSIIKIQQALPALGLLAFVMKTKDNSPIELHFSTRRDRIMPWITLDANQRVAMTIAGTFLTLSGFICQNIGVRGLHWSAGVLQLDATLILTCFRGLARRHVGNPPDPAPIQLFEGGEASQLASDLEGLQLSTLFHYHNNNRDIRRKALVGRWRAEFNDWQNYQVESPNTDLVIKFNE